MPTETKNALASATCAGTAPTTCVGLLAIAVLLPFMLWSCAGPSSPALATVTTTATAGIREFRDCADCPMMVALPGGDLWMGSPDTEEGRTPDEGPQRHVTIAPFAIGKLLVTRAEWKVFVTDTARPTRGGCSWRYLPGTRPDGTNAVASWENLGSLVGPWT